MRGTCIHDSISTTCFHCTRILTSHLTIKNMDHHIGRSNMKVVSDCTRFLNVCDFPNTNSTTAWQKMASWSAQGPPATRANGRVLGKVENG